MLIRRQRTLDTRELDDVELADAGVSTDALVASGADAADGIARSCIMAAVLAWTELVGIGERVLEMTIEYAKFRVQFGRPIASFQAVKHKCATMRVWAQESTAAMAIDAGLPDTGHYVSVAKSYASDAICQLVGEALQVHGGIGFTWEHDLHLFIRRARCNALLCGDIAHHRSVLCRWLKQTRTTVA